MPPPATLCRVTAAAAAADPLAPERDRQTGRPGCAVLTDGFEDAALTDGIEGGRGLGEGFGGVWPRIILCHQRGFIVVLD